MSRMIPVYIAVALFVLLLAFSVHAEPVNLTEGQVSAVETTVKHALKDPESARLSQLGAATAEANALIVCGMWNAKNSMGGYVGDFPYMGKFWSHDGGKTFEVGTFGLVKMTQDVPSALNLISLCHSYGVELSP